MVILLSHLVCIELFNWTVQANRKHLSKVGVIKGPGGVLTIDGLVCGMCDSDFLMFLSNLPVCVLVKSQLLLRYLSSC